MVLSVTHGQKGSKSSNNPRTPWSAMVLSWWVSVFLLVLVPFPAAAQATGAITGVVTDDSGAVVPGVTIEVTSLGTSQVRSSVTGADGVFTVPLLNPGIYEVRALLSGFRTAVRD